MLRSGLKVTTGAALAATTSGYIWARSSMGDDALDRLIEFDAMAIPAIASYKFEEARCYTLPDKCSNTPFQALFPPVSDSEATTRFEALHHKYSGPLFDVYMKLGGFYYKSGQKMASNMGGLVPKIYRDKFQPFLNDIPARDPKEVRSIVEEQLGCPRESVFSFWEDKPIGCASIGQVHRATLTKKHGGTKVVVKVQNPSAERTFVGDVFALRVLMDTFMPQFSVAFDEIQKQFATEFDYRGECRNAIEIRDNLRKGGFTNIIVPEVYPELCTQKIMVMEEIAPSITLHDALDKQAEQLAQAAGMTKKEYTDRETARVEQETMALAREGKTPSSVSSREYDKYIMLQRLKQTMYNWTVGWVWAADVGSGSIVVPLNAALLIDDLLYVHGHEVLIDGCFNGDPHPGNVLCAGGKLALIDYGQVKRIGEKERMDMSKMVLLVSAAIKVDPRVNRDVDMEVHRRARKSVANHGRAIGMETEKMLEDTFYDLCVVYYGRMDAAFLYPRNVIQWSDWMQERDPLGNIDKVDYSVMLTTATMMLRGLGEMLQQYRNLADVWKPIAQKALKEKGQLEAVEDEIKAWGGKP